METRQVFGSKEVAWEKRPRVQFCSQCGSKCEEQILFEVTRDVCTGCGKVYYVNLGVAIVVLVVDEDRVLLCKRARYLGYGGLWCTPSGSIELSEDFLTAGLRETVEETSVFVEVTGLFSVVSNFWDHGGSNLVVVLLARPIGGTPGPTAESEEVAWFRYNELPEMAWEGDRHAIERYFATREPEASVDLNYVIFDAVDGRPEPPPASRYQA